MKTEFLTKKVSALAVLILLFSSIGFADEPAPSADDAPGVAGATQLIDESLVIKGVLRTAAGPGGETTGVELCPRDDLNNVHGTAIEVDFHGLKDEAAARDFVTGYGEPDKVVEITGVYEYLNLGPMRPHFKALLVQNIRAD